MSTTHTQPQPQGAPFAPMLHPDQRPAPAAAHSVMLNDGTTVLTDSLAWQQECLGRQKHVHALRWLPLEGRREYFANVERREGTEAALRLKRAYAADWEKRRDAEAAARAELDRAPASAPVHSSFQSPVNRR